MYRTTETMGWVKQLCTGQQRQWGRSNRYVQDNRDNGVGQTALYRTTETMGVGQTDMYRTTEAMW